MRCKHFFVVLSGLVAVALLAADASATYHPTLGRWLQRDPIGYADGMGLYEYAASKPLAHRDSLGLSSDLTFWNLPPGAECTYSALGDPLLLSKSFSIVPPFEVAAANAILGFFGVEIPKARTYSADYLVPERFHVYVPLPGLEDSENVYLWQATVWITPYYWLAEEIERGKYVGLRCRQIYECQQDCRKTCCDPIWNEIVTTDYTAKEGRMRFGNGTIQKDGLGGYTCVVPEARKPKCPQLCTKEYAP